MAFFHVLLLGCGLRLCAGVMISPKLEPKSSKKFFNKDYPVDHHPVADENYHFDHPYPAVQDSGDYNNDYVKDQNADGGKWQAQMEYDILRQKLRNAEKELGVLKQKMESQGARMEEAKEQWRQAVDKVNSAKDVTDAARQDEDAANQKVDEAQDEVNKAAANVEKEMSDLEKCKKALEDAKERLRELMKKQETVAKKSDKKEEQKETTKQEEESEDVMDVIKKAEEVVKGEDKQEAAEQTQHQNKELEKRQQAAQEEREAEIEEQKRRIADELDDVTEKEAVWNRKLSEEKAEYSASVKDYEAKMKAVRDTEAALKNAKSNLKKYRRPPHVDNGGGVYNVPQSSASILSLSTLVVATVAIVTAQQ